VLVSLVKRQLVADFMIPTSYPDRIGAKIDTID